MINDDAIYGPGAAVTILDNATYTGAFDIAQPGVSLSVAGQGAHAGGGRSVSRKAWLRG